MKEDMTRILVVDDEPDLSEGLRTYLELEGYDTTSVASAEEALEAGIENFDLILLDIMMEGMSGTDLAAIIRKNPATASIPIIFVSAKDSTDDMVNGLRIGADDYISKPYSAKLVLARIEAVLRRSKQDTQGRRGVKCDRSNLTCTVNGREIRLPRKEFEILALMLDNPGRIFTREELLERVWPEKVVVTDRSVDVHITRLRSKITPYGGNIITRSGYGYGWQD